MVLVLGNSRLLLAHARRRLPRGGQTFGQPEEPAAGTEQGGFENQNPRPETLKHILPTLTARWKEVVTKQKKPLNKVLGWGRWIWSLGFKFEGLLRILALEV